MGYGVEELAAAAGIGVDTLRYYQAQGLLERPKRVGRRARYGERHLATLRRIRALKEEGLPLAVIRRVLRPGRRGSDAALARALRAERGARRLTRSELARESGVPEVLIEAVERTGLLEPLRPGEEARYEPGDVDLARAALALLGEGLPLDELLSIAKDHARHVAEITDRAATLFNRHVRRDASGRERDLEEVVAAFHRLLPAVTTLVAHHFQRTLVARALRRLEERGDREALARAREASRPGRLEIRWS